MAFLQNSYNVEIKGWMFAVGGVVAAGLAYLHVVADNGAGSRINTIDAPKVVTECTQDIEDAGNGKKLYCRCWKSKKFPYCDGSHNAHNTATGDLVGPLVITSAKTESK